MNAKRTGVHVALLRGINLGGANKLPMAPLVKLFEEAGCTEIVTYIQSGNVVFRAPDALARRIPALVAAAITKGYRLQVPVVTRTAAELRETIRRNPYLRAGADPSALHVAFLADRPSPARIAELDPARSPPDQFTVRGRDVYLLLPHGVARTKLNNQYFDSRLATISTVRNWRTVLRLLELTTASSSR